MNKFPVILFALVLLCSCKQKAKKEETVQDAQLPNIVFILADDLGYGDLGSYGQTHFSTPHIDQLALDGMKFTNHYAGATVCAPSRACLMTGLHAGNAFVKGNEQNPEGHGQLPMPSGTTTMASLLKKQGYATGCFGKWGLGNAETTGAPLKNGFDAFFGYYDQVLAHNSFPEFLFDNTDTLFLDNEVAYESDTLWHKGFGSVSTQKRVFSNDVILEKALNFVDEHQKGPFFLYFPTTVPHMNDEADFDDRFEVPDASAFDTKDWTKPEKDYAALVQHLDNYVGQIVKHLDSLGLTENTMVIFTSDNGPVDTGNLDSNGPLRGIKRDVYEGGIRVPLLIKWPGNVASNSTSDYPSAFWDFLPTFCEMAQIKNYGNTDGLSLLPELTGKKQPEHPYLYWEFQWWQPTRKAIRIGDFKGVSDGPDQDWELYNLATDISEENNIAEQYPDIIKQMDSISTSFTHKNQSP